MFASSKHQLFHMHPKAKSPVYANHCLDTRRLTSMAASASANGGGSSGSGGGGGGGKAGGKKFVPLPDGAPFSQAELDTTLKVHSVAFGHQPARP